MLGIPLEEQKRKRKNTVFRYWICPVCEYVSFNKEDKENHLNQNLTDGPHLETRLKNFWKM